MKLLAFRRLIMENSAVPFWLKRSLTLLGITIGYAGFLLVPAGAVALIVNGDCGLAQTAKEAKSCNDGMLHITLIVYCVGAFLYPLLVWAVWIAFGFASNNGLPNPRGKPRN